MSESGGKNKIIMIAAMVALLGAGLAGGMFLGKRGAKAPEEKSVGEEVVAEATKGEAEGGHGEKKDEKAEKPAGAHGGGSSAGAEGGAPMAQELIHTFDRDFTVNLLDPRGRWFVKTNLVIKVNSAAGLQEVQDNIPPLRDATIMLLSSKTADDLRTVEGKERLKRELMARYSGILSPDTVSDIYYDGFTVVPR